MAADMTMKADEQRKRRQILMLIVNILSVAKELLINAINRASLHHA